MNFNDTLSENALFNYAALSFIPGIDPFNETVNVLNEYINNNQNSSNVSELQDIVIHLLLNSNDYSKALKTIEGYKKISPELENIQSQLTYNVGFQYYEEGNYKEAINYFKRAAENKNAKSSIKAEALFWMADSYYRNKEENNAYKAYITFLNEPMSSSTDVYALAYYNLGYILLNNGDFANASVRFKEFLNIDKSGDKSLQCDSWLRIGDCYFIQRQYSNAITSYSNAMKLSNKNADYAYYQQAMGYGALGKTNEKINCLNIITSRHQKSNIYDKALYEIGMAYLMTNDNRSAIASFDKIVNEKPRSSYARKALMKTGMIYYNNNENEKALERLKNVVAQYPNTDESREALNIISNIYRDENNIQAYFSYLEDNNLETISIDKQDSLSFKTIEEFYSKRNHVETIKGVKQYLENYPNGAYLLKVHYYAMKSMENSDNKEGLRTHIEYIINQPDNDYTDNALLLIARMDYDNSDYSSSAAHYERLIKITENQQIMTEATEGCMKSYYFDGQYDKAIANANLLVAMPEISDNQKNQANYILGKSYFDKKDYNEALKYFEICTSIDKSETGAECGYYSAVCLYNLNKFDKAEEKVFEVSDNYNSYIYWTARSFITLSDVYVAKDNTFQAKETLKSVIENYPQDEDSYNEIIKEAQDKLNSINKESNE
jgi:TolA-binding protein